MKCYVLKDGEYFNESAEKQEISSELEQKIYQIIVKRRARNLAQTGNNKYGDDGIYSRTEYDYLDAENFVIKDGKIFAYYAVHFDEAEYVLFDENRDKIKVCSFDYSDYSNGTGNVNRGFIDIVKYPDTDTNPYYDQPRFHSQEEYDDYIKWRD